MTFKTKYFWNFWDIIAHCASVQSMFLDKNPTATHDFTGYAFERWDMFWKILKFQVKQIKISLFFSRCWDSNNCGSLWSGSWWLVHSHPSCQCFGLWKISNHPQFCHGALLDGRFHGSHDLEHLVPSIALRMGRRTVQTSLFDNSRIRWYDVEFDILGSCFRQIRQVMQKIVNTRWTKT